MTVRPSVFRDAFRSGAAWLVKGPVWAYRLTFSAFLGHGCRFHPTCSAYALEAVDTHGPVRGAWLTIKRLGRCHPWGGAGVDPVPQLSNHDIRRFET